MTTNWNLLNKNSPLRKVTSPPPSCLRDDNHNKVFSSNSKNVTNARTLIAVKANTPISPLDFDGPPKASRSGFTILFISADNNVVDEQLQMS